VIWAMAFRIESLTDFLTLSKVIPRYGSKASRTQCVIGGRSFGSVGIRFNSGSGPTAPPLREEARACLVWKLDTPSMTL